MSTCQAAHLPCRAHAPDIDACAVQNLHKGVLRDKELYRMKLEERKAQAEGGQAPAAAAAADSSLRTRIAEAGGVR